MINEKKALILLAIFFTISCIGACRSQVPLAPNWADIEAKKFVTDPDMAQIYIFRDSDFNSVGVLNIYLDGEFIGGLSAFTYLVIPAKPGRRLLPLRIWGATRAPQFARRESPSRRNAPARRWPEARERVRWRWLRSVPRCGATKCGSGRRHSSGRLFCRDGANPL